MELIHLVFYRQMTKQKWEFTLSPTVRIIWATQKIIKTVSMHSPWLYLIYVKIQLVSLPQLKIW